MTAIDDTTAPEGTTALTTTAVDTTTTTTTTTTTVVDTTAVDGTSGIDTGIEPTYVRAPRPVIRRIPLARLVQVELRKMFDTRSGYWLMASIVITSLLATGAVILFAPDDELTYSTFGTAIGFPMAVILPMIAILSVTSEWSQRSGLTTFTLVPHRSRVIWAKAIAAVGIGVVSMLLALAIGAAGNVAGTAITGTPQIWDITVVDALLIVLGNVLGLLIGFMLGLVIRNSPGAIVAYFLYSFLLPTIFLVLATNQEWFRDLQPWVDVTYAQAPMFEAAGNLTGEQWANVAVTGLVWLVIPMLVGLRLVTKSEVK
jgi:ABC-2 type transport system permease protein